MAWWAWIVVGLALLVLELAVPSGFFLIFFGASALILGALTLFILDIPAWLQWIAFSGLSLLLLLLFRQKVVAAFDSGKGDVVDSLVQQQVSVTEAMSPGAQGSVTLRGSPWRAVNVGTAALAVGDRCTVVAVEGLTLKVSTSA